MTVQTAGRSGPASWASSRWSSCSGSPNSPDRTRATSGDHGRPARTSIARPSGVWVTAIADGPGTSDTQCRSDRMPSKCGLWHSSAPGPGGGALQCATRVPQSGDQSTDARPPGVTAAWSDAKASLRRPAEEAVRGWGTRCEQGWQRWRYWRWRWRGARALPCRTRTGSSCRSWRSSGVGPERPALDADRAGPGHVRRLRPWPHRPGTHAGLGTGGFPQYQAGWIKGAATVAYCPQYAGPR